MAGQCVTPPNACAKKLRRCRAKGHGRPNLTIVYGRPRECKPFCRNGWGRCSPRHSGRASSGATTKRLAPPFRKLAAQGVAIEEKPPGINGIDRICRIHGRRIHEPLGAGNHRRRRITSPEMLMRRLLALDYVLQHSPAALAVGRS